MSTNEGKEMRIGFTPPEVITMVGLTWNAIKSVKNAAELDWTVVRVFTKVVKAAKDQRLDISEKEG
jgi:hypothetical protein